MIVPTASTVTGPPAPAPASWDRTAAAAEYGASATARSGRAAAPATREPDQRLACLWLDVGGVDHGEPAALQAIREHVKAHLPAFSAPRRLTVHDELPRHLEVREPLAAIGIQGLDLLGRKPGATPLPTFAPNALAKLLDATQQSTSCFAMFRLIPRKRTNRNPP